MSASETPRLTELRLRGFKCFRDEIALPLRSLNLLSGINSKGKSTVLQALLLLHQGVAKSTREHPAMRTFYSLDLNGRSVRLGTYREVLHRDLPLSEGLDLGFEVTQGNRSALTTLRFVSEQPDARTLRRHDRNIEGFIDNVPVDLNGTVGRMQWSPARGGLSLEVDPEGVFLNAHYVSADRLGPQEFYRWADEGVGANLFVGVRGEHSVEVLREGRDFPVHPYLCRDESETPLLPDQASAWLGYVFDGGALKGAANESVLTLQMNSDGSAHYVRPVHMGFGFSYVLPILVAGLVAEPGSLLIIENPEAHLHPLAQSRLGEFLAQVAATGIQVFVESHSEHILNAFRLAVRSNVLTADELSVLYFRGAEVDPVLRIPVDPQGGIKSWPDGFFDQRLHDFQRLFGV